MTFTSTVSVTTRDYGRSSLVLSWESLTMPKLPSRRQLWARKVNTLARFMATGGGPLIKLRDK